MARLLTPRELERLDEVLCKIGKEDCAVNYIEAAIRFGVRERLNTCRKFVDFCVAHPHSRLQFLVDADLAAWTSACIAQRVKAGDDRRHANRAMRLGMVSITEYVDFINRGRA